MYLETSMLLLLIISGVVFFYIALTISSLGTRINPLPSTARNPHTNGNLNGNIEELDDSEHGLAGRLSAESTLIGRSLQATALMTFALAMLKTLDSQINGLTPIASVLLSIVISAIGAIVFQLLASLISGYQRNWAREISRPTGVVLKILSVTPGVSHIVDFTLSKGRGEEAVGEEVTAALQESLDFLEESVIPADQNELRMIRGILRMDTVKVREIMVPRVDVIATSLEATIGELADLMTVGGHSKIPIYKGTIDSIAGVVYARDVLAALDNGKDPNTEVEYLARRALHVPESQSLERLLRQLQEHRTGLAVVVDE